MKMSVKAEGEQFILLGFGFNAFGQLSFPAGDRESQKGSTVTTATQGPAGSAPSSGHEDVILKCTPTELMRFPCKPKLQISSTWDALHIHVETDRIQTVTTGRWLGMMEGLQQELQKDEDIARIFETRDFLLLQTSSRSLLCRQSREKHARPVVTECKLPCGTSMVSLSDGSMFALTSDGTFHQCSFESLNDSPIMNLGPQVSIGIPIAMVSSGTDHVLLLSRSGSVFSFGLGSRGQLGHGDILPRKEPCLIEALAGVAMKAVACGYWHSLALSEYGDVYSWGWNEHGQLGHSANTLATTASLPNLIETPDSDMNFISISCGARHSTAVTDSGQLYTWGWNGYGQLGHSQVGMWCSIPSTAGFSSVISVYCGPWCTMVLFMMYVVG